MHIAATDQSWIDSFLKGVYKSKKELSSAVNIHSSTISRTTRLCFFSPTIIDRIAAGTLPDISVNKMIPVTTPSGQIRNVNWDWSEGCHQKF